MMRMVRRYKCGGWLSKEVVECFVKFVFGDFNDFLNFQETAKSLVAGNQMWSNMMLGILPSSVFLPWQQSKKFR